ncbi:MAG: hypothetical protein D4R38_02935 [Dehalococcoidia bacterium]|nr:MAG: hypothetical protein D4R38_02935 [Dehalococcoidia bacterium]
MMRKRILILIAGILLIAGLLAVASCNTTQTPQYPYAPGGTMGPGSIMGPGGMMGSGTMGPGGQYQTGGQRLTMDQAHEIVADYVSQSTNADLEATEIMEFEYNFYVIFTEKSTGIHAFESLIDPYTGDLYGEPGPNMMWNTKYGNMSGMMWGNASASDEMTVSKEQAIKNGQAFIDDYLPGAKTEEPDRFYGYYTLHVIKDGAIYGMLSVNGYTGQVWHHSWHGRFIGMEELAEH